MKTRPGQCVQGLLVYGFTAGRVRVFNLRVNSCVQAERLQKTAEQIRQFGVDEARCMSLA